MPDTFIFANIEFDRTLRNATFANGETVKFTRAETSLLNYMVKHPGQVLTRGQMLDAVNSHADDKLDRSIDFLINRLRRKLKDSSKAPKFIETLYGEGYVWCAIETKSPARNTYANAVPCHAVVGPIFGLDHIGEYIGAAESFAENFHAQFQYHFSSDLKVAFIPDCPSSQEFGNDAPEVGIELSFVTSKDGLECVIRGNMFKSGNTVFAKRLLISNGKSGSKELDSIAADIAGALRKGLSTQPDATVPLAVGMIEAGKTFTGVKGHWSENDEILRAAVQNNLEDHHAKIMLATNIHTKYLQDSVKIFSSNTDTREADEDEIEALVTKSLPHIQNEPTFLLPAAKLLFFVDRGYRDMAVEIAERAHKKSTALSSSLPVIGQMHVFMGQNETGLAAINQALEWCEAGTQFEVYLLILKCEALAAVADRDALDIVLEQVCKYVPQIEVLMYILFANPDMPSKIATQALVNLPQSQAKGMLMFFHYVYGRLLQNPEHRANAYKAPMALFSKQFGPGVIPEEIRNFL